MNWGMPTDSAASLPLWSRMVALRSFDWLRIGVVAVLDTYVAISNETVSMAERITDAVTLSVLEVEVIGGPPHSNVRSVSSDRTLAATCGDLR